MASLIASSLSAVEPVRESTASLMSPSAVALLVKPALMLASIIASLSASIKVWSEMAFLILASFSARVPSRCSTEELISLSAVSLSANPFATAFLIAESLVSRVRLVASTASSSCSRPFCTLPSIVAIASLIRSRPCLVEMNPASIDPSIRASLAESSVV